MNRRTLSALALTLAAGGLSSTASAQVLYSNGPLITTPAGACIPVGQNSSALQGTNNTLGSSMLGGSFRVADDFTVPAGGWSVSGFNFWGYQTGAGTGASTFTAVTVRIWNGPPNAGGTVIAGDTTSNVMTSSNFDLTYRHGGCGLTRPLFKNTATLAAPVNLAAGTYWVDFDASGTIASGPWVPLVTITGNPNPPGANALQFAVATGVWTPITDGVGLGAQDVPFEVLSSVGVQGACCFGAPGYNCAVTTQANCQSQSGTFLGNNTLCNQCPPAPTGACCLAFGGCAVVTQASCIGQNGTYAGDNVTCGTAACAVSGRCCFSNGSCLVMTQTQCTNAGGTYGGNNSTCSQGVCPQAPGNILCNGPFVTSPTGACVPPGEFSSALQTGNTVLGSNFNGGANFSIADDFTVPAGSTWTVSGFTLYGYQTGSGTPVSSFTGATCQIWNGPPNAPGSVVVAGDSLTNVMTSTSFTGAYRHAVCDLSRPIYDAVVTLAAPAVLTAGTYWVDFNTTGSLASGPWVVPATITGVRGAPNGNALQRNVAAWAPLVDGSFPQDATFCIKGTVAGGGGCYANCDGSTGNPLLTANDFQCFLNKYAGNDTYANCDGSTGNPLLTANDFQCFLNKYAGGCT